MTNFFSKFWKIFLYLSETNQPEVGYYPSQKSTKCEMRSDRERICQNGGQTDFQTAVALEKVGVSCFCQKRFLLKCKLLTI